MKATLLVSAGVLFFSASIFASGNINFTTEAQARQYCPDNAMLTFAPDNHLPYSAGIIQGAQNGVPFASAKVQRPQLGANNSVEGAAFDERGGLYGYLSGNLISCFYTYQAANGGTVFPILQGRSN